MSRLNIRSGCKTAVATSLILALLASAPFSGGLLLHDHSDRGLPSHTVTLDDLRHGASCAEWHRYHDEDRDENNNDSDGGAYADPLLIFVNAPNRRRRRWRAMSRPISCRFCWRRSRRSSCCWRRLRGAH